MITLNLPENQKSKINANNLAAFENNYDLNATLYCVKPCFVLRLENNELIFKSVGEFNGWSAGAIYQLDQYRFNL